MEFYLYSPLIIGGFGLISALSLYWLVLKYPITNKKIQQLSDCIHRGAMVFMRREYWMLFYFLVFLFILLWGTLGIDTAIAFLVGAFCSALAGWFGMYTATHTNGRTAQAAYKQGQSEALKIAFYGGSIMGLTIAALGLLGIGGLFYYFGQSLSSVHVIHGFGMGASSVALFSRVGGGIYTKSADIGADLVGKLEINIPEDDPRNPGVIADNVGDNVGDIAGMGADIFESYCGSMIASITIAATMAPVWIDKLGIQAHLMFLPLVLAGLGLVCSLIGVIVVRLNIQQAPELALRTGTISASVLFMINAYFVIHFFHISIFVWYCVLIGAFGGVVIGLVTEYYTGGKPIREIARSGKTGPATVLITGFANGMESVVLPVTTLCAVIFFATFWANMYGVGIAAVGMLSTVGMTMAIDAYGPIADNAGGIAEMSHLGKKTRRITDELDALGNTTAAIGKGFAVGAAGLAALAIISAYMKSIAYHKPSFELSLADPEVLIGLLLGGLLPYLIGALTLKAVGQAAGKMIQEIRRQFDKIPGLLEGKAEPDTTRCIDIATTAALHRMLLPGILAIFMPVVVGFGIGAEALGGFLGGALLSCVLLALMMANAGGAWDNAKKYVEQGHVGGKGSKTHAATVVGDTVGDPFKDTAGPSMNILINVMAIVSLVIAPLLV